MRRVGRMVCGVLGTIVALGSADAQARPQLVDAPPEWMRQAPERSARNVPGVGISSATVYAALLNALLHAAATVADDGTESRAREDGPEGPARRVRASIGPCVVEGETRLGEDADGSEGVDMRQRLLCRLEEDTIEIRVDARERDGTLTSYEERLTSSATLTDNLLGLMDELGVAVEWAVSVNAGVAHAVLVRVPTDILKPLRDP